MTFLTAWIVFIVAVIGMMAGSYMLSGTLDQVGSRYHISPGLMGLVTALGSDSPEITSAVTALLKGEHEVGIGVVLGSNLFNIAALLGLGAVLAGHLPIQRGPLVFNTGTSLVVTVVAILLLYGALGTAWTMLILAAVFVLYALILWLGPDQIASLRHGNKMSRLVYWAEVLAHAGDEDQHRSRGKKSRGTESWSGRKLLGISLLSLAMIVVGAVYTVRTALMIWAELGVPRAMIGSLIVAILSSLPNAYTSAHLAREREGTAVVSETINSNTINIIVGFGLPALVFGLGTPAALSHLEIWWLLAMTAAAMLLPLPGGRLGRAGGAVLIVAYLVFVGVRIWTP